MDHLIADRAGPTPGVSLAKVDRPAASESGPPLVAEFAVAVESADAARIERSMALVINGMGGSSALVRNFNYAEAQRLEQEWRLAQGEHRDDQPSPPAVAQVDGKASAHGHPMSNLAQRVREHWTRKPSAKTPEASGPIAGVTGSAPSLEQQLEFSSRGASHSVAVPVSQLDDFLEQLDRAANHAATLRLLPAANANAPLIGPVPPADNHDALTAWVQDGSKVRAMVDRLKREHPNATLLIPVMVIPATSAPPVSAGESHPR